MLTVATYFWTDAATKHKFTYSVDDVRRLRRMVYSHLTVPHRFTVITDKAELFADDPEIRVIPLDMRTHVPGTCFVRLFTFHPAGASIFGERLLQIDLDTLIVCNINKLVSRPADNLVVWRNPSRIPWDNPDRPGRPYYNTSMLLHRCGSMPHIWADFDPARPGCRDDQWWLSDKAGPDMPYWDGNDGVYRLGRPDTPGSGVAGSLPDNARVVTFPGSEGKWWEPHIAAANPWIKDALG